MGSWHCRELFSFDLIPIYCLWPSTDPQSYLKYFNTTLYELVENYLEQLLQSSGVRCDQGWLRGRLRCSTSWTRFRGGFCSFDILQGHFVLVIASFQIHVVLLDPGYIIEHTPLASRSSMSSTYSFHFVLDMIWCNPFSVFSCQFILNLKGRDSTTRPWVQIWAARRIWRISRSSRTFSPTVSPNQGCRSLS